MQSTTDRVAMDTPTTFPLFKMKGANDRVVLIWVDDKNKDNPVRIAEEEHSHYLWDAHWQRYRTVRCAMEERGSCKACEAGEVLRGIKGVPNPLYPHRVMLMQGLVFKSSVDVGVDLPSIVGFRMPLKVFQDTVFNRIYDDSTNSIGANTFACEDNNFSAYAYEFIRMEDGKSSVFSKSGFMDDKLKVLPEAYVEMVRSKRRSLQDYGVKFESDQRIEKYVQDTIVKENLRKYFSGS